MGFLLSRRVFLPLGDQRQNLLKTAGKFVLIRFDQVHHHPKSQRSSKDLEALEWSDHSSEHFPANRHRNSAGCGAPRQCASSSGQSRQGTEQDEAKLPSANGNCNLLLYRYSLQGEATDPPIGTKECTLESIQGRRNISSLSGASRFRVG